MNAQEKVLAYAHKHNTNQFNKMTDQELAGRMAADDYVIERHPGGFTFARITRKGNEIIITETTVTEINRVENGKMATTKESNTVEVERISL